MQEFERKQTEQSQTAIQPLTPAATAPKNEPDDDPDAIFLRAVAEIDTQPLVKRKRAGTTLTLGDVLEIMYLVCWACGVLFGSMYLAATVPHTLVIVYAKSYPAQITAAIVIPTRPLAPVTITRSQIAPTTGHGYQSARAARGLLTLFNGSFSPQSLPIGMVLTSRDGVKIVTNEAVSVPAAQPPHFAEAQVPASAVTTGSSTNIAAGDITLALSGDLQVKNLTAFTGGKDARTYKAVASQDLQHVTSATTQQVQQALPQAFPLRDGEGVYTTACTTKTAADHAIGEEATTVTVTVRSTCQGIAYSRVLLTKHATAAFTATRPGTHYHMVGSIQMTITDAAPLTVTIDGWWAYTFSTDDQTSLAKKIAGAAPLQARTLLVQTGVIADASIPSKLPPDGSLIDFLIIVG